MIVSVSDGIFQAVMHFLCHRDKSASALGLCFLYIVSAATFPDKLRLSTRILRF